MKKVVILLFSLTLLVLLAPVNGSAKSIEVAETPPTADHPIQPPV